MSRPKIIVQERRTIQNSPHGSTYDKTTTSVSLPFPLLGGSSPSENKKIRSSISSSSLIAVSIKDNLLPEVECFDLFGAEGPLREAVSLALLTRNVLEIVIAHCGTPTALPRVVVAVWLGSCSSSGDGGGFIVLLKLVTSIFQRV